MRLTREQFNELVKKRPHLLDVGAVESPKREPSQGAPLVKKPRRQQSRQGSVVAVVAIIACRHRPADLDNIIAGCKPLRDAIARSLGVDDGDARVRWEYGQLHTSGDEGCIVKLERIEP